MRKALTIIYLLMSVILTTEAQKVTFFSEEFEAGVKKHIGLGDDEDVTQNHTDTISAINLSGLGITDIRDVKYLSNVLELDLSNNGISNTFPLTVLDSLQILNLSNNELLSINPLVFSNAKKIRLNVAYNYIEDFSFFYTPSHCQFTIMGMDLQSQKDAPFLDVYSFYSEIEVDDKPIVVYRGYTNMATETLLNCGSSNLSAQLDGNTYHVAITEDIPEILHVILSNGEKNEDTYIVPSADYHVEAGQSVTLETGLPDDYYLSSVYATVGAVEVKGNCLKYTAPESVKPDIIYFSFFQGATLKGFSRYYINRGEVASEPITIGKSGKASYCGDKSLDFSFSDEVKAYIATGFDKDEGTIWLTRVKDVPAGVPVLIKGNANKTYDVPVTDSQNSYYTNMFVGNTSGEKMVIQETDGDMVNYYLSGDGTFKSVNKTANIGTNKCYLQLPGTFEAAATGATQTVKVGSIGKASFAAPVDLDFTNVSGLKAFTATGYDKSTKTIWLTRVMKVQKGEGVLLKGDPNSYEIPSAAVQSSYENMFVGNTSGDEIQVLETSEDGSQTNYYLKGDGSFVSVNGYVNIKNNKCYLALPTSMVAVSSTRSAEDSYKFEEPEVIKLPIDFKSIGSEGGGTTSIREVKSGEVKSDEWFTLQGQRVDNPGKGVYIKNGRKVVIK